MSEGSNTTDSEILDYADKDDRAVQLLTRLLELLEERLRQGCIASVTVGGVRVRRLPIHARELLVELLCLWPRPPRPDSIGVATHRLSTVRHADQILVMEGGRIVERSRHQELVKQNGRYAGMVGQLAG